jgi:hypothetical protein
VSYNCFSDAALQVINASNSIVLIHAWYVSSSLLYLKALLAIHLRPSLTDVVNHNRSALMRHLAIKLDKSLWGLRIICRQRRFP